MTIDQNSPEARSKRIGGSDAASVLGVSPWKTPVELWLEKTGQAVAPPMDEGRCRVLERGKKLEPIILEMLLHKLRERGHEVELLATNRHYVDKEHAFLTCEIDFELMLDGEHVNGDCKTVHGFARKKWGEADTEEVPIEYAAQFMHGLMVTGRSKCLVAALIGLDDVAIYWVTRDDETIAGMRAKEIEFWRCVQERAQPDVFTFDDIKLIYPKDNGQAVNADEVIAAKVLSLKTVKEKIKAFESEAESLTFEIAEYISPHALLDYGGKTIATWKAENFSRLDQKRLKEEQPELHKQYTKTGTQRVLRLK